MSILKVSSRSYGAFIDVNQYTVATEIFPTHLRSQGSSYSLAAFFLTDVLWVDLAATAQAKIGWKYYLVFLVLGTAHLIHLWLKLPEVCYYALFFVRKLIWLFRHRV
jgi:Sugar (and other) transporter